MTFDAVLDFFDSPLWGSHVKVPADVAASFIVEKDRRVVCTLNGAVSFQCALMPSGGQYFILVNKKTRDKLKLQSGSPVTVSLQKDDSKYGLPMPEEMAELLAMDAEADRLFHALTPGKQRNLLYIAGQPKGSDIRLKRAVVLTEHLKANHGKINFKQLALDLKDANKFF